MPRVDLGVVRGAYGLKGWIRIAPFSPDDSLLTQVRECWLGREGETPRPMKVEAARKHGRAVIAKLAGVETPEQGEALRGVTVAVARSAFPPLEKGEAYWVDLIGARVVNRDGRQLGRVRGVRNFGAQDLMEVGSDVVGSDEEGSNTGRTLLIPMVQDYVESIDGAAGLVKVDWEPDWS